MGIKLTPLLVALIALPAMVFSATLEVCPTCTYQNISSAVEASSPGDSIEVQGGSYTENVLIDKSLAIRGVGEVKILPSSDRMAALYILGASDVSLSNLAVDGRGETSCIAVDNAESTVISDLTLDNCLNGVEVSFSSSGTLSNLDISGSQFGVRVENSSSILIEDSTLSSSVTGGVILRGSTGCTLRNLNSTHQETANGIYLYNSHSNTLEQLNLEGGDIGIALDNSDTNGVTSSSLSWFGEGIEVFNSANNEIEGNDISSSSLFDIVLLDSQSNLVHGNDFNSPEPVYIEGGGKNRWNTSRGNYWSDYSAEDANGDGIGDTPYIINSENVDYLPAISPYTQEGGGTSPPPSGGGGSEKVDPLKEKFATLDPELFSSMASYFGASGEVYDMDSSLAAFYLALEESNIYPSISEATDTALGSFSGDYPREKYQAVVEEAGKKFVFSQTVVVARGDIPADAYTAIAYARIKRAPLLLTPSGSLPQGVEEAIRRLQPGRIVVIGGPAAVAPGVVDRLSSLGEVVRLYGKTRVETSVAVTRETRKVRGNIKYVVIQDGWDPDPRGAIVASWYRAPQLYVNGGEVPQETRSYLRELRGLNTKFIFAGVNEKAREKVKEILS